MPIGGFSTESVEREVIELTRALLQLEEVTPYFGDDPDDPQPFLVEGKNGNPGFESKPYVNVLVAVVDDYGDGTYDGRKFWDKLFLTRNPETGKWGVSPNAKLGRIFKSHPKYGPRCFENPNTVYDEEVLRDFQFEAGTEQREDMHGRKLQGTRIAFETIGPVPKRKNKAAPEPEPEEPELDESDFEDIPF